VHGRPGKGPRGRGLALRCELSGCALSLLTLAAALSQEL
jgi:hypothetical protein